MWAFAAVAGALVTLTGFTPRVQALEVLGRVGPVLVFLVAITVVAELADAAGVFDAAARAAARAGRGRTWLLWLLIVVLATAATTVLSLDTTAVLLTPVVLTIAAQLNLEPGLFAMTTVWLANTASLLLPVSNLTNLLAVHRLAALGVGVGGYLRLTWAPALVSILVTAAVLAALFRGTLTTQYTAPPAQRPSDRVLFTLAAGVCLGLGPVFLTGVTPAWPASVAAAILVAAFATRRRTALRAGLLPWRLVLLVLGLFLVVQGLQAHGLPALLSRLAGTGTSWPALLRLASTAAAGANAVDNLPAYLALEPVAASSPTRIVALLIGVNLGPLITVWASLATLLWRERCATADVNVSPARFARRGLLLVPALLLTTTAALALTS